MLAVWEPTASRCSSRCSTHVASSGWTGSGLLATRTDGRRHQVALAHPLYGEMLRARMSDADAPAAAWSSTRRGSSTAVPAAGRTRSGSRRRVSTPAGRADPELLIEAARLARWGHDFAQVERLARAALLSGATPEAGAHARRSVARARRVRRGRDRCSTEAQQGVSADDPLFVLIVEIRALNLMWGLHRHEDALAVNRAAQASLRRSRRRRRARAVGSDAR